MKLLPLTHSGLELVDAPAIELSDKPLERRLWPLLKPVDAAYMRSVGKPPIDLTPELLQTLAAVYDPTVDAAPLKFDHISRGPAEGWVRRVLWRDGVLWIEPLIFEALERGIRAGQWGRLSAEIHPRHPETQTPYLSGVAVLGAASPAIKSLPFKETVGGERPPLIHLTAQPASTPPKETESMSHAIQIESPPAPPPPPPVASNGSPPDATTGDGATLALEQRLETLNSRIEAESSRLSQLTRQNLALSVGNRLDALADRLPFAFRRAIEPVLLLLESTPSIGVLKLSHGEGQIEASPSQALFLALEQLPHRPKDLVDEVAGEDDPNAPRAADKRTSRQRRFDLQLGITDEERLELEQKYPTAFTATSADEDA